MRSIISDYISVLLNMVYPKRCINCGAPLAHDDHRYACDDCWNSIEFIDFNSCIICSKPLAYAGGRCSECRKKKVAFKRVYAAVRYRGLIRTYLHRVKFGKRAYLMKPLAHLLKKKFEQIPKIHNYNALIPVPLHPARMRERGFNQADMLCDAVAEVCGIPVMRGLLNRIHNTVPQFSLSKDARIKNISSAFSVRKKTADSMPKRVILIDDIFTTGSTLSEASAVLKKSGVKTIVCLIFAKD